ncbi:M15 family metallopeptidase [Enterococcus hirae]|uniref:M15 family metallopeptidase n=1 Tax=Enterococcus hirae TaxID=1354 RepID=UPI00136E2782|nr:M15 family metallopeptidase [Enterococcus hirae]NAE18088.1 hypothetical protein [Enterococcus hirae]
MSGCSQNGWPVIDHVDGAVVFAAGGRQWRAANMLVGQVARAFIERYSREVEPVTGDTLDDWSWAVRNVRDSTSEVSNHASATAWDLNALDHVRGKRGTFTASQLAALGRLLGDFPVIRWGGNYSSKSVVDEMHFEINVTAAGLKAWCATGLLTVEQYVPAAGVTYHPAASSGPITIPGDDLDMDRNDLKAAVWEVLGQDDVKGWIADAVLTRPIQDKTTGTGYGLADRVTGIDRALYTPIPSRVKGSAYKDTPAGFAANADAYLYQLLQIVSGQKAAIDSLAQAVTKGEGVTPEQLSQVVTDAMKSVVQVKVSVEKKES